MIEAASAAQLPSAEPTDSDDVRWALETATAMWTNGDFHEALRWLRRAAESASEEGADMRAVELAKLGAELRGHLAIPTSIPPPAPAPEVASIESFDQAAEALLKSGSDAPAWPSDPYGEPVRDSIEREVQSSPSRPSLQTQLGIGPDGQADGEAEATASPPAALEPGATTSAGYEPDGPPPLPSQPSSDVFASASSGAGAPRATELSLAPTDVVPAPSPTGPGAPTDSERRAREPLSFVSHQALRVAITTSPERRGVLIAKVLETGERAPPGAKEALFVALEPGIELY